MSFPRVFGGDATFPMAGDPYLTLLEPPYTRETTLAADAAAELIDILRQSRNVATVEAMVRPLQEVENAIWDLLTRMVSVDDAEGELLQFIGRKWDLEKRAAWTDEVYRQRIRAKQLEVRSNGRVEELIAIALLIIDEAGTGHVWVRQNYPGSMDVELLDATDATTVEDLRVALGRARAGGVNLHVISSTEAASEVVLWGDATAGSNPGTGHGDATDAGVGGYWADVTPTDGV